MEQTFRADEIKKILQDKEYTAQELHDIIKQMEIEKALPDSGDVIIFHEKKYTVKRATYAVIRKVLMNPIFQRNNALMTSLFSNKWYHKISFIVRHIEKKNYIKSLSDWNNLLKVTFEGDLKEMALENLTPSEVSRIRQIFFRFQQADSTEGQEKSSKTS